MTRIIIEVPFEKDLSLLLSLLQRLNAKVIEQSPSSNNPTEMPEKTRNFILQGLPERANFEDFVQDFEKSRADAPLPGRA
jgi:hypothetical protein